MLQRDMQKKISCLKNCRETAASEAANGMALLNERENLRHRLEGGYVRYQRQNSLPVKLKPGKLLAVLLIIIILLIITTIAVS